MQRRLIEILACPVDKHNPLRLVELESRDDNILTGVLVCPNCNRIFPIIEEIPKMLPDSLRKKDQDAAFLAKWKDSLPPDVGQPVKG